MQARDDTVVVPRVSQQHGFWEWNQPTRELTLRQTDGCVPNPLPGSPPHRQQTLHCRSCTLRYRVLRQCTHDYIAAFAVCFACRIQRLPRRGFPCNYPACACG